MKRAVALSIAVAAFTLLTTQFASAQMQSDDNPCAVTQPAAPSDDNSTAAMQQAMEMVPAQASLDHSFDSRKVKQGDTIKATLIDKVQLKDGTELPGGTKLTGMVTVEEMQKDGTFRLALVFSNADLRNGKVIPIKATIVKVYTPEGNQPIWASIDYPVPNTANTWTAQTTAVNQHDALNGVDLESRIGGSNSGNFVTKKNDIKVSTDTVLDLAISPDGKG